MLNRNRFIIRTAIAVTLCAALLRANDAWSQRSASTFLGLPLISAKLAATHASPVAELGRRLFFDARLSKDGAVSCASCHIEAHAFMDNRVRAKGFNQRVGTRNTPSLLNVAFNTSLFWDGRRTELSTQALDPLLNPLEHGLQDAAELRRTLSEDASYRQMFRNAFGSEEINEAKVGEALAAFQNTLLSGNSAFDQYRYGGDANALSAKAKRGYALFVSTARCAACHTIEEKHALFTDQRFHAIGIGREKLLEHLPQLTIKVRSLGAAEKDRLIASDPQVSALGRFVVTGDPKDIGAFRTPSLRNVARTAPYMHDGSVATLEEAVRREVHYRSTEDGRPLILTPEEIEDLVAFLRALNGND